MRPKRAALAGFGNIRQPARIIGTQVKCAHIGERYLHSWRFDGASDRTTNAEAHMGLGYLTLIEEQVRRAQCIERILDGRERRIIR